MQHVEALGFLGFFSYHAASHFFIRRSQQHLTTLDHISSYLNLLYVELLVMNKGWQHGLDDWILNCVSDCAGQEPTAAILFIPPGLLQSAVWRKFKAHGVRFSSDPTGPVGMMYAGAGMPTMSTLNHHRLAQIGLMRTIWTTVSQTPAQMNGIPFHTRLRTLIFRSLTPPLSFFFINLFYKLHTHTHTPPLFYCSHRNINPILSWLWLWLLVLTHL